MVLLKSAHADMVSLRDVKENAVDEEQEGLDIQELAPAQAQVEEELCEALVVNTAPVQLLSLVLTTYLSRIPTLLKARLLLSIHETLVFLVELLATLIISRVVLVLHYLFKTAAVARLCRLFLLLLLALKINLPVLFCRLVGRILIEVKNQTLLNFDVQVDVLLL